MAQACSASSSGAQKTERALGRLRLTCAAGVLWAIGATAGIAGPGDKVGISGLSDVAFGSIANLGVDSVRSQSVCLYAKSPPSNLYRITANGSGAGGAFLLDSGSGTLSYEVQWSDTAGQTSGSQLLPNQPLSAQQSSVGAGDPGDCSKGPTTTASLIVILRSAALGAASSGTYNGTLTLLVAPE